MAQLDITVSMNEYIANTESEISVLVNGERFVSLSGENRSFSEKLQLPDDKIKIVVRRSYVRSADCDIWWKRIFSALLGMILLVADDGKPFSCLYEMEEQIELELSVENAALEVRAVQKEDDTWPLFVIRGDGCKWTSSRKITMSKKELEDTYKERKRLLSLPLWIPFALCVLGLLSLLMNGYTTTVVALLAFAAVFGGCSLISILALRKQYQKLLNQI